MRNGLTEIMMREEGKGIPIANSLIAWQRHKGGGRDFIGGRREDCLSSLWKKGRFMKRCGFYFLV